MRLGLAAWGLRETPLEEQLKLTRDMGLSLLEFSIANYSKDVLQVGCSDAEIEAVKSLYSKYGISLECGCTGNDLTVDDVAPQVEKLTEVIGIASKLGIRYLRIFAGFRSDSEIYGERWERMLNALKELHLLASAKGLLLCVETHGGVTALENGAQLHFNSVTTRGDCWEKILETGVSILFDPANLAAAGAVCPCKFYERFRMHIRYLHLKDFRDVPGGIVPAACGEGRLDYKKLLETIGDYSGPALFEYELTGDVEDGMRRSLSFLKAAGGHDEI